MYPELSEFSCYNRECLSDLTEELKQSFSILLNKVTQPTPRFLGGLGVTDKVHIFCKNCNELLDFDVRIKNQSVTIIGCGVVKKKYAT